MRLLYITESAPNRDPVYGDGSSMIPYEILRNLPDDVDVTLLSFEGRVGLPEEIRERCAEVQMLTPRPRAAALIRSLGGLNGAGRQERATREAAELTASLSARADATLIHGPHALFLSRYVHGPLVLQTVDPWSVRTQMDTAIAGRLKAAYRAREFLALRAERRLPARARLLTVGAKDAARWSASLGRPVRSIPNGADQAAQPAARRDDPVVCFVGSLNYGPNIDSAQVLVRTIAPLVWESVPRATFVLAGRRPDPAVLALAGPRVEVAGNVPSVLDVYRASDVAAFPDEHGVGIRNSVREALAAGVPVVATPVAAREQEAHPLLTVVGDPEAFARRVVEALENRGTGAGTAGPETAGSVRSWQTAALEYLAELQSAIGSAGAGLPARSSSA